MADNTSRIVVGFDGSTDAEAALVWASETARALEQRVQVVIVAPPAELSTGHFRAPEHEEVEAWRDSALRRLDELAVGGSSVESRRGPVVPTLIEAAEGASMIAVGSAGHGLVNGTMTGSVSQHIARHAECPVVVVRPQRSPHARRIVVGVDGSAESDRALHFACERAQRTGESVSGIHGYTSLSTRMMNLDPAGTGSVARRIEEAERFVTDICAAVADKYPGVEIEPEAIAVRPAQVLVDASAVASLVVVGSRGRDAFAGLLLGSVSQHVLHHAECPVAIVR